MNPLFIPLKSVYFDAFKSGEKDTEYRVYGKRWNFLTCAPGRKVTLSRGYGKHQRLTGVIKDFWLRTTPIRPAGWVECYGNDPSKVCACIKIEVQLAAGDGNVG